MQKLPQVAFVGGQRVGGALALAGQMRKPPGKRLAQIGGNEQRAVLTEPLLQLRLHAAQIRVRIDWSIDGNG